MNLSWILRSLWRSSSHRVSRVFISVGRASLWDLLLWVCLFVVVFLFIVSLLVCLFGVEGGINESQCVMFISVECSALWQRYSSLTIKLLEVLVWLFLHWKLT